MACYDITAPKRSVRLMLDEDVMAQARAISGDLSEVVETLLASYVAKEQWRRAGEAEIARETSAVWNRFEHERGSFADEHSTLG